jgi:hypothetical protein
VSDKIIARSSVFELPASTFDVVDEVLQECGHQDAKWGEQNHMPPEWFAILGEEFGEVAKETVNITFAHPWSTNYRMELIQTAAVAIRMVEAYDRRVKEEDRKIEMRTARKLIPPRAETKGRIPAPDISDPHEDYQFALEQQRRKAGG